MSSLPCCSRSSRRLISHGSWSPTASSPNICADAARATCDGPPAAILALYCRGRGGSLRRLEAAADWYQRRTCAAGEREAGCRRGPACDGQGSHRHRTARVRPDRRASEKGGHEMVKAVILIAALALVSCVSKPGGS